MEDRAHRYALHTPFSAVEQLRYASIHVVAAQPASTGVERPNCYGCRLARRTVGPGKPASVDWKLAAADSIDVLTGERERRAKKISWSD